MSKQSMKIKPKSRAKYSFKQWCIDNNRQDMLERWDYELNKNSPDEVAFRSNQKYYFKCPKGLHKSDIKAIHCLTDGAEVQLNCIGCNSFGQKVIDEYGEERLKIIWSDRNEISPFEIRYGSAKKIWVVCEKNSEHTYEITVNNFFRTLNCPICRQESKKEIKEIHLLQEERKQNTQTSLVLLHPEVVNYWSTKNEKGPEFYQSYGKDKVWWKCKNGVHEDFQRTIKNSLGANYRCPKCSLGKKKNKIPDWSLIGEKFGTLTVKDIDETKTNRTYYICECECGAEKSVAKTHLINGYIVTCGSAIHRIGENGHNWRNGSTKESQKLRSTNEYKEWQKATYAKDWYTCQCCGRSYGIIKNAHHIQNMSSHPELMYDIDNSILMCKQCHYSTEIGSFHHTYGTSNNTPEQLESYINQKRKELNIPLPFSLSEYNQRINILKPNTVEELMRTTNNNQNNN